MSAVPLIFNEALNVSCHGRRVFFKYHVHGHIFGVFSLVEILRSRYGGEYFNGRIVLTSVCAGCRMDPRTLPTP
jgi:hypothetical protein